MDAFADDLFAADIQFDRVALQDQVLRERQQLSLLVVLPNLEQRIDYLSHVHWCNHVVREDRVSRRYIEVELHDLFHRSPPYRAFSTPTRFALQTSGITASLLLFAIF